MKLCYVDMDCVVTGLTLDFHITDREPEHGCKTRTKACGENGLVIRLEIVKGATKAETLQFEYELNALSATMLGLTKPWL